MASKKYQILYYIIVKQREELTPVDKITQVRTTRRWSFRIFMELIVIDALNAYTLWIEKFPEWKAKDQSRRKEFICQLSIESNVDLGFNNPKHHKNSQYSFHIFKNSCYLEENTPSSSVFINNSEVNLSIASGSSGKKKICFFDERQENKNIV